MVGYNDVVTEVFTLGDAQVVKDWAASKGVGMLSMWSVNRDQPGSLGTASPSATGLTDPAGAFTHAFSSYGTQNVVNNGSGGGGSPVEGGATTVVEWKWNTKTVLTFDPAKDKLDFDWMGAENFVVDEDAGSTRISITGNDQTYTLQGVALRQLHAGNIVAKDAATAAKWQHLIEAAQATSRM